MTAPTQTVLNVYTSQLRELSNMIDNKPFHLKNPPAREEFFTFLNYFPAKKLLGFSTFQNSSSGDPSQIPRYKKGLYRSQIGFGCKKIEILCCVCYVGCVGVRVVSLSLWVCFHLPVCASLLCGLSVVCPWPVGGLLHSQLSNLQLSNLQPISASLCLMDDNRDVDVGVQELQELQDLQDLQELMHKERQYRHEVEEERDFLLRDNGRLRRELHAAMELVSASASAYVVSVSLSAVPSSASAPASASASAPVSAASASAVSAVSVSAVSAVIQLTQRQQRQQRLRQQRLCYYRVGAVGESVESVESVVVDRVPRYIPYVEVFAIALIGIAWLIGVLPEWVFYLRGV
jgi:hypothetical protein